MRGAKGMIGGGTGAQTVGGLYLRGTWGPESWTAGGATR